MQINLKKIIYSLKDLLGSAHNHPDLSLGLLGPNERGQGFLLALDLLRSVKNLTRPVKRERGIANLMKIRR
jgi:hypothetical protein